MKVYIVGRLANKVADLLLTKEGFGVAYLTRKRIALSLVCFLTSFTHTKKNNNASNDADTCSRMGKIKHIIDNNVHSVGYDCDV